MSVAAETRKDAESMTIENKFLIGNRRYLSVKEFRYDSKSPIRKKRRGVREIKGERLRGAAESSSSATSQANSSAASFPGRNESPGTHCSLIVEEKREDRCCQIYRGD